MEGQGRIAALVEGSLLAALVAAFALAGLYVPPLQFVINLVLSVPVVVAVVRLGLRMGVMATLVAGLLVVFFTGPVRAFLLFFQFAPLGLVYGHLFKSKASPGSLLAWGVLVALLSLAANLVFSFWLAGLPLAGLGQELDSMVENTMVFYRQTGMLQMMEARGMTVEQVRQTVATYFYWLKLLLPGIMAAGALVVAGVNFFAAQAVMSRLKLYAVVLPPFRYWQLPWYVNWGFIAGLALWLAGDMARQHWVLVVGLNILYLYLPLLAGNGVAAATFIYHRLNWPPVAKALIVLALSINVPAAVVLLLALGLFDPFLNYRRFKPSGGGGGED